MAKEQDFNHEPGSQGEKPNTPVGSRIIPLEDIPNISTTELLKGAFVESLEATRIFDEIDDSKKALLVQVDPGGTSLTQKRGLRAYICHNREFAENTLKFFGVAGATAAGLFILYKSDGVKWAADHVPHPHFKKPT